VFLDDWAEVSERHRYEYAKSGARIFSLHLQQTAATGTSHTTRRQVKPLVKLFHEQLKQFLERLEKLTRDDYGPLFFGRFSELIVLAADSPVLDTTAEYDQQVIELCRSYLAKLNLPADERTEFETGVSQAEARINYRLGKILDAIKILETTADDISESSPDHGNLPALIEMLKSSGQFEKAIEVGLKAKAFYQKTNDQEGHITVVGQLCQIYKRTGELEQALELARSGFTLAAEIDQKYRQPIFKLDECNILQVLRRFDEAIEAAQVASRLFRIHHDDAGDLRCYGALGQCYLEKGDLKASRKWLMDGYQYAKQAKDVVEQANFAGDLGTLEAVAGNQEESSKYYLEALRLFLDIGHYEGIPIVVTRMIRPCLQHRNYELFSVVLSTQILIVATVPPIVASSVVPVILRGIMRMIDLAGQEESRLVSVALRVAWEFGSTILESSKAAPSDHLRFLLDTVAMFGLWLDGQSERAVNLARTLDQVSRGVFGLEKLVSASPS
jgi:tetratricopeptide (TPR) repeat protein